MSLFSDSNAAALPNASSDIVAQVPRQGQKKHGSAGEVEVRLQMKDFFDDQSAIDDKVRHAVNYLAGPVHCLLFEGRGQDRRPSRPQGVVPAGFRGPEDRHDGIAHELVNDAPMLEDDLRGLGQRVAEKGDDLLAGDAS